MIEYWLFSCANIILSWVPVDLDRVVHWAEVPSPVSLPLLQPSWHHAEDQGGVSSTWNILFLVYIATHTSVTTEDILYTSSVYSLWQNNYSLRPCGNMTILTGIRISEMPYLESWNSVPLVNFNLSSGTPMDPNMAWSIDKTEDIYVVDVATLSRVGFVIMLWFWTHELKTEQLDLSTF